MGNVAEMGVAYTVCSLPVLSTDGAYPVVSAKSNDVLSFSSKLFEEVKADMEGVDGVSKGSGSARGP